MIFFAYGNEMLKSLFFWRVYDLMTSLRNTMLRGEKTPYPDLEQKFKSYMINEEDPTFQKITNRIIKSFILNDFEFLSKLRNNEISKDFLFSHLIQTPIKTKFAKNLFQVKEDGLLFSDFALNSLKKLRSQLDSGLFIFDKMTPEMEKLYKNNMNPKSHKFLKKANKRFFTNLIDSSTQAIREDLFNLHAWRLLIMSLINMKQFYEAQEALKFAMAIDMYFEPFWKLGYELSEAFEKNK